MRKNLKIYLIAGEASGDYLGAKLIQALRQIDNNIEFYGVGGNKMSELGLKSLFPISDLSLIGFFEIIPHLTKLIKRLNQVVNSILAIKPAALITIDAPAFNFRVARKIKNKGILLIHYVAPSVWAYNQNRAQKIAGIYDQLLTLLPFEPPFFLKFGLKSDFIGHELVVQYLNEDTIIKNDDFLKRYNLSVDSKIISLLPGSRRKELTTLLPIFLAAIKLLETNYILFIIVNSNLVDQANQISQDRIDNYHVISDPIDKIRALKLSQAALVKSGTITLEVAALKIPMLVAYRINFLSGLLLKFLIKVKFVSIINILANKSILPEYLQDNCNSKDLATGLLELLTNDLISKNQITNANIILKQLVNNSNISPSNKAASIIMKLIYKKL